MDWVIPGLIICVVSFWLGVKSTDGVAGAARQKVAELEKALRIANIQADFRLSVIKTYRQQFATARRTGAPPETWRAALGIPEGVKITKEAINAAYKKQALVAHPDKGGSVAAMSALNVARQAALKVVADA